MVVRKVLFVDDDQIMLLAIEKRFAKHEDHFSMVMANDGFEAVQKLKDTSISLIVLDLKMPRMDGMSLLSHTREKYPDIPVIIVSGYRTAEMYKLAKSKGVIAYISKPFQVDDLGNIILSTLQKEADGGIMHNVSPTVFLQLMEMEAKTCTIRVIDKNSGRGGILYFIDGNLLDVRIGETNGIDAAYEVFSWDEVTLFIQNNCAPRENQINCELQPIIMKAVGMKDENGDSEIEAEDHITGDETVGANNQLTHDPSEELGSLDLPDEFFEMGEEEEAAADEEAIVTEESETAPEETTFQPPSPSDKDEKKEQTQYDTQSKLENIQSLIQRELGATSGIEDITSDESMDQVVSFLNELGSLSTFGELKVGYIDNGDATDRIVMPGERNIILKVNEKCPQDKLIETLSRYKQA